MRRRVVVEGVVQGVSFREATRREAERHRVDGWVRNRTDGAVEAVFEGAAAAVGALVAFCRLGPPGASVTALRATAEAPEGLDGFRVIG